MSPEPIQVTRPPTGVRLGAGAPAEAIEALVQRRIAAARAEGVAEGRQRALAEGATLLGRAGERLDELRSEAAASLPPTAVQLALEIARALLVREVAAGNYDIEGIVRSVLAQSNVGRRTCVVHVNPVDAGRLREVSFRAGTSIEPDMTVQPGDVHVTTPDGLLVREIERALVDIEERLLGDLR